MLIKLIATLIGTIGIAGIIGGNYLRYKALNSDLQARSSINIDALGRLIINIGAMTLVASVIFTIYHS